MTMTISEAFEHLSIICEPFGMIPVIRAILVQVQANDLQAAYHAVTRALADPCIMRAKPIYSRLTTWETTIRE